MLCSKRFERFRNTRARGAVSSIFGRSSPAHVVYPGFVVFDRGNGFREINQSSAPASRSLIVYTFYLSSLVAYTWHLTVSSYRARSRLPARYFSPPLHFFRLYYSTGPFFARRRNALPNYLRRFYKRRNKRDRQLSRRVRRIFKNLLEEEVEKGK